MMCTYKGTCSPQSIIDSLSSALLRGSNNHLICKLMEWQQREREEKKFEQKVRARNCTLHESLTKCAFMKHKKSHL